MSQFQNLSVLILIKVTKRIKNIQNQEFRQLYSTRVLFLGFNIFFLLFSKSMKSYFTKLLFEELIKK
ncbi:hypothetical protein CBP21_14985 [Fischerella thermalis WC246]|nr:hypothetical protein CBP19_18945 [Fischerella thermalis WC1110]PLZ09614.1 hypothetical protein CBP18_12225 [Fischerella thermalis WC119]PLZ13972.1 hypothetical protein CBP17_04715 [Fischerella thermalis WC114]PLZ29632.1 hypothetical protein CBP10_14660 [Fischerella thermalis WC558]PLZ38462.1 hypothetical protein CBP26_14655 [Fischerella thermalis WC538]PLZ40692.1 hypothetical protein CBP25_18815 [Fischerella thermalis WC527]PLZ52371.1 hypothetical protein CBP24_18835 [Fischerella thermalis